MLANNNQQETPQGGGNPIRKKVWLPENSRINKKLVKELDDLFEYVPPERLSRNLRNLLLSHLELEADRPLYFEDLIADLYFLFQFLDVAADELNEI